ncbi:hypothetical protein GCM10028784_29870 [Myceligenerans cantabricum]
MFPLLYATLTLASTHAAERVHQAVRRAAGERGGVSIEAVAITVGLLVIAGVVLAAMNTFVEAETGRILSPND